MHRKIIFLALILLTPTALSYEIEMENIHSSDAQIRDFEYSKDPYSRLLVNTRRNSLFIGPNATEKISLPGNPAFKVETKNINGTRYWATGSKFPGQLIVMNDSSVLFKRNLNIALDQLSFTDKNNILTSTGTRDTRLYSFYGELLRSNNYDYGGEYISDEFDVDQDGLKELFLGNVHGQIIARDENIKYTLSRGKRPDITVLSPKKALINWKNGLSLNFAHNGTEIWRKNINGHIDVINLTKSFLYSNSTHIVYRNIQNGNLAQSIPINSKIRFLKQLGNEKLVVGSQENNVSVFNLKGEKLASVNTGEQKRLKLTQADEDSRKEIAISTDKKIKILDITGHQPSETINHSLNQTAFIGQGKRMLKAVALNQTSFISKDLDSVKDELNSTGLKPVNVNYLENVNEAFNITRDRYYIDSRKKAVYVAALAAKNNASLTFDSSNADRDFSNYSIEELQELFIEEFEPNHIAVADLESEKGVLAAYMAARKGVLPIDFDREFEYVGEDFEADNLNDLSGVYDLELKIEEAFDRIGANKNTVFDGRYISILDGPRRVFEDPVENGIISDPEDGVHYYSDLEYGNLDDDRRLEAAVGRYPRNVSMASKLFHRSLKRQEGKEAVVASEYLHSSWPVILATFGGGMRSGLAAEKVLEKEGFDTTHLVEHRAEPIDLILDLANVPSFLSKMDDREQKLTSLISESSAKTLKNAMIIIRGLEYAERALEIYLEFEWSDYVSNFEVDVPEEPSLEELENLVSSLFPDRRPEITQQALTDSISSADLVYYSGVGNSEAWNLPDENEGLLSDNYPESTNFSAKQVPETDKSIVFDSSTNAGLRTSEIKDKFLEKGSASFIGFSSVNYHSYSSYIGLEFLKHGNYVGESLIGGVNSLRSAFMVYSPTSSYKFGVREKMENSASLYGNPETIKDPIPEDRLNKSKECSNGFCTMRLSVNPAPEVYNVDGQKHYLFNTTDYILREFRPITPIFMSQEKLPEGSEVENFNIESEYRLEQNVSMKKLDLLSHDGSFHNLSLNYSQFPERTSRFNVSGNEFEYVQAGMQKTENGVQILESAELVLNYTTPVSLEFEQSGGKLMAEIYSDSRRDVELAYEINGSRTVEELEVQKGNNVFKLGNLSPGRVYVEGSIYQDDILASDSRTISRSKELEIFTFAPDMAKGDTRSVTAVVRNPNEFKMAKSLSLETGEGLILNLLEPETKTVEVSADSNTRVSWEVLGLKPGNHTVEVGESEAELEVRKSRTLERILSPERLAESFGSESTKYRKQVSGDELKVELRSPDAKAVLKMNSSSKQRLLETPEFTATHFSSPSSEMLKLETSKGHYTRTTENGVTRIDHKGIEKESAQIMRKSLFKETDKLLSGQSR